MDANAIDYRDNCKSQLYLVPGQFADNIGRWLSTIRYLLKTTARTNNLLEWRSKRCPLCSCGCPASLPRIRCAGKGYHTLHKLSRWIRNGWSGNLRYDVVHSVAGFDSLRRTSGFNGEFAALWRGEGETVLFTTQQCYGTSAKWRLFWTSK